MLKKAACIALWTTCAFVAGAKSQKLADVKGSRTEIENERVVVRRNVRLPHAVTPMHSHNAGVVVYLTDVRERSTAPDGTSKIVTHKAGDVLWATARQHALENLGDAAIEAIEVELK
jgi:quercetin dioxygenase-like cupin family protein